MITSETDKLAAIALATFDTWIKEWDGSNRLIRLPNVPEGWISLSANLTSDFDSSFNNLEYILYRVALVSLDGHSTKLYAVSMIDLRYCKFYISTLDRFKNILKTWTANGSH